MEYVEYSEKQQEQRISLIKLNLRNYSCSSSGWIVKLLCAIFISLITGGFSIPVIIIVLIFSKIESKDDNTTDDYVNIIKNLVDDFLFFEEHKNEKIGKGTPIKSYPDRYERIIAFHPELNSRVFKRICNKKPKSPFVSIRLI